MDIKEAAFLLLDFAGYRGQDREEQYYNHQIEQKEQQKKEFILPEPAVNNAYLYSYLTKERGISKEVVDYFVKHELIYESKHYHNIVFKGNDKEGVTRFANKLNYQYYI